MHARRKHARTHARTTLRHVSREDVIKRERLVAASVADAHHVHRRMTNDGATLLGDLTRG
jgi:hypothetical protein